MIDIRNLVVVIAILALCTAGTVSGSEPGGQVWLDGTPLIHAIHEEPGGLSGYVTEGGGRKAYIAGNFTPGDLKSFVCTDFATGEEYTVNATCRATGEHCYLFVEENRMVGESAIRGLVETFDRVVHPTITGTFGNETGVDEDPRVFILLLDIRDGPGVNATDLSIVGYFDGSVENNLDIIFLDADAREEAISSTLAHEFQHLVHHSHDPHERTWVDEGCSGYAEYLCSGSENRAKVQAFNRHPGTPLVVTDGRWARSEGATNQAHYGASFLWTLYLAENFGGRSGGSDGGSFLRTLVAENRMGLSGVNATLERHGYQESFEDVFKRWVVANYLDAEGSEPPLGYAGINLTRYPEVAGRVDLTGEAGGVHSFPEGDLLPWSAAYYEVRAEDPGAVSYSNDRGFWMERIINQNGDAVIVVSPLGDRGRFVLTVAKGNLTAPDPAAG